MFGFSYIAKRIAPYLIIFTVAFSSVFSGVAFAENETPNAEETESASNAEKTYTDITSQLSMERRSELSDYLCRFGACYTTDFEGEKGGKVRFDEGWSDIMSEIIWWQYLAYSKSDRENPNAPIYGNLKLVTPETLRQCVKDTFDVKETPSAVRAVADSYYIDHSDGNYHPPQQDPSGTMWTRSPESCKIQYVVRLESGDLLVQYIPEYLKSAEGMHSGSLYYAKLKEASNDFGYVAYEIGTISALDDEYVDMGFIEDAQNGARAVSNIEFDYERFKTFGELDEYDAYLREVISSLGGELPNGPGVNDIAAYISAACSRLSKVELKAENNFAEITPDTIGDGAEAAEAASERLWDTASEFGVRPNKTITVPIQIVVTDLNEEGMPTVTFDESLKDEEFGFNNMRILLGDNSHGILLDKASLDYIIEELGGGFRIEYGMTTSGYLIKFYNSAGEELDEAPTNINFSIPAQNMYDSVYVTSDGRDFNIGGEFDDGNTSLEFKTKTPGQYKVKNNEPKIDDIGDLSEEEQEHIKYLVSKDYFTCVGGSFRGDEQYTNYNAARAVASMLFAVDTDSRTDYSDVDETDPSAIYVASIENAGITLYSDQGGLKFNGNSAVGLEDTLVRSMGLLVEYKGYYPPEMSDDEDRPYASPYLNFPDCQYMQGDSLDELALGVREGIINDGMALTVDENRFDRKSAAELLYRLFERMCETSPVSFDADGEYRSDTVVFNPLSTMSFEPPAMLYLYIGCLVVGLIFAALLYIMGKKNKIHNETAEDAGEDSDYWDEF